MIKVLSIFGTRPEAIKMAPVVKELEKHSSDGVKSIVCVTGQHRQMLDAVLSWFDIKPDVDLDLMEKNQSLYSLTSKAISALANAINQIKPDISVVQGDTTTAMVASLASFYEKVPVAHVEAGLRTRDRYRPFPEEINRRLVSVLATYNFAPTQTAIVNLLSEGFPEESIFLTGNTVIDALLMTVKREWTMDLGFPLNGEKLVLVTAHRRENFGDPLKNICNTLIQIANRNPEVKIVYPVHPNPNVQSVAYSILSNQERIYPIEPLQYQELIHLMNRSYLVLTDSGGLQEEAPALGKPVLIMRTETERQEGVEAGVAKIVGTDPENILRETELLLNDPEGYARMSKATNPYGDGRASERIVRIIMERLG